MEKNKNKISIISFNELPSTNLYLKENYVNLDNFTIVIANHQTAGRGRLGRTWKDDDDLLFSILLKDRIDISTLSNYSLLMASIIYKVLKDYFDNVKIKWPNDIIINDKKVAGILSESIITDRVECLIIGVGINVNSKEYSDDLLIKATSLSLERKYDFKKEELLEKIITVFNDEYNLFLKDKSDYLDVCKKKSYVIGKNVKVIIDNIEREAKVLDILKNGNILLLIDGKKVEKSSGEITLKKMY